MADPRYGCEVGPNGPAADMFAIEPIAGTFPSQARDASPAAFTGGTGGQGLGGSAETSPEGGTTYQRIGF